MNNNIGFVTALGTPTDFSGNLNTRSMRQQIDMQIDSHAAGLLALGSMGIQPYLRHETFFQTVKTCCDHIGGRIPLYVGVSDLSVMRVMDRIDAISGLPIDAVVSTVPYYNVLTQNEIYTFYREIARNSAYPLFLYDLPAVTKTPIAPSTIERLMNDEPNIRGIKTAQLPTIRSIRDTVHENFSIFYSGLDTMDMVISSSVPVGLDGMFCVTGETTNALFSALRDNRQEDATLALSSILRIRDTFISYGVFSSFTAAMNLIGLEGRFHPDYCRDLSESEKSKIEQVLKEEKIIT
jgi:4-hydroxy-tetrahydrodipicolinate synthase